jgi:hypothetical protein
MTPGMTGSVTVYADSSSRSSRTAIVDAKRRFNRPICRRLFLARF